MRRVLQLALGVISVAAVRFPASPFDRNWLNRKSKPREYSRTNVDSPVIFQDPLSRPYYDGVEATWTMDMPERDLSVVSEEYYTRLVHPAFPQHSVRIRKTKHFCEPNAWCVQFFHSRSYVSEPRHVLLGHTPAMLMSERSTFTSTFSSLDRLQTRIPS